MQAALVLVGDIETNPGPGDVKRTRSAQLRNSDELKTESHESKKYGREKNQEK